MCRRHRLPRPEVNVDIEGHESDRGGLRVVRITHRRLVTQPEAVAAQLSRLL